MKEENKSAEVSVTFRSPSFSYKGKVYKSKEVEAKAKAGDIEAQKLILELVRKKSSIVSVNGLSEEEMEALFNGAPGKSDPDMEKDALDKLVESLQELLAESQQEAATLKGQLSDSETEKALLQEENTKLQSEVSTLQAAKSDLVSEVASLKAKLKKKGGDHA